MKLRKELFDGYSFYQTIASESNLGKQVNCYVDPLAGRIFFLLTCRHDDYTSKQYDKLEDVIKAWNEYK